MKSLLEAVHHWYESIPAGKRWTVWAFAILVTGFSILMVGTSLLSGADPATDPTTDSAFLVFDVLIKLVVVVLLIFVSAAFYQKWNRRSLAEPQRLLKVRETARLSARQALHVVQVGEEVFLIGATDQNITLISAIDPGEAAVQPAETEPAVSFFSILKSHSAAINGQEK